MNKIELFKDLIVTLKNLPYRDKEQLEAFQKQVDSALSEIFGLESQARKDFRNIRFAPRSFYSTAEDYLQSWKNATSRGLTFLENILNQMNPISVDLLPLLESKNEIPPIPSEHPLFDTTLSPQEDISNPLLTQGKTNPLDKYILELEFAPEAETINVDEMQNPSFELPMEKEGSFSRLMQHENSGKSAVFNVLKLEEKFKKAEKSKIEQLESAIEKVKRSKLGELGVSSSQGTKDNFRGSSPQLSVFVTSTDNQTIKEEVILTLQKLDLKVILPESFEQEGVTLIKSLTDSTEIRFAVAILSQGDISHPKDQNTNKTNLRSRRMVFDLGFLVGKLGRDRVFVLHDDIQGFEFPTTFYEVLYTPFTNKSGWQLELLRYLKKAGYTVDANRLI